MSERKQASSNIHTYVRENKSTFDQEGFNNIDGLVMTQISAMDLGTCGIDIHSGNSKTFTEIYMYMTNPQNKDAYEAYMSMSEDNRNLLRELASSPRYQDMSVSNYVENPVKNSVQGFESVGTDSEVEQFGAVTITYTQDGEKVNYMSFRPTNGTSDGWTEDVLMISSEETQAQADSVAYMNIVAGELEGKLVGGGHSKGGNDFEYGYLFCDDEVRERIVGGYIYDSPGLHQDVLDKTPYYEDFQRIIEGNFICPQDSVIGQLLQENKNAKFVYSVESHILQHDPYSWEIDVKNREFQSADQTFFSMYLNDVLDKTVNDMTEEERAAFYTFVFYVLQAYEVEGDDAAGFDEVTSLFKNFLKNPKAVVSFIIDRWGQLTETEKEELLSTFGKMIVAAVAVGYDYAKSTIEKWCEDIKIKIKAAIDKVVDEVKVWFNEKWEAFKEIINTAYQAVVTTINNVVTWYNKNFNSGYKYASSNPCVQLNTALLRAYAERLQSINNRIASIDRRMDSLYWKVGLQGLWDLMQADALTGYSWRLSRCINYLNDTASDFENVERELMSQL